MENIEQQKTELIQSILTEMLLENMDYKKIYDTYLALEKMRNKKARKVFYSKFYIVNQKDKDQAEQNYAQLKQLTNIDIRKGAFAEDLAEFLVARCKSQQEAEDLYKAELEYILRFGIEVGGHSFDELIKLEKDLSITNLNNIVKKQFKLKFPDGKFMNHEIARKQKDAYNNKHIEKQFSDPRAPIQEEEVHKFLKKVDELQEDVKQLIYIYVSSGIRFAELNVSEIRAENQTVYLSNLEKKGKDETMYERPLLFIDAQTFNKYVQNCRIVFDTPEKKTDAQQHLKAIQEHHSIPVQTIRDLRTLYACYCCFVNKVPVQLQAVKIKEYLNHAQIDSSQFYSKYYFVQTIKKGLFEMFSHLKNFRFDAVFFFKKEEVMAEVLSDNVVLNKDSALEQSLEFIKAKIQIPCQVEFIKSQKKYKVIFTSE